MLRAEEDQASSSRPARTDPKMVGDQRPAGIARTPRSIARPIEPIDGDESTSGTPAIAATHARRKGFDDAFDP